MQGRDYVERVFNCDDLLLNYLMAHKLGGRIFMINTEGLSGFNGG